MKRTLVSLLLDAGIVIVLAFPALTAYAHGPLLALYVVLSARLVLQARAQRWIFGILHKPATRIVHGLEHAALAVCSEEADLPAKRGFTHGTDRFVIVLAGRAGYELPRVRAAAIRAVRRVAEGEHHLAYQPGCGTSDVVAAAGLWLVYVITLAVSAAVGWSAPVFIAVGVIVLRLWLALRTPLGLLAQRLFTVSTDFADAHVVDIYEVEKTRGMWCPSNETWFEVWVDVRPRARRGGLVPVP